MYLGAMTFRLKDGSSQTVAWPGDTNQLLAIVGPLLSAGALPIRPDGAPYSVSHFGGGEMWDGCPIQVAVEEADRHDANTWVLSQIEVMKAAGMIPGCLVPGSPNYNAYYGGGEEIADSGTGKRTSTTPTVIVQSGGPPAILTTGMATPAIMPLPGGGASFIPAEPAPATVQAGIMPAEEESGGSWWPWILAALFIAPKVLGGGYLGYRYYRRRRG